uniref:Major facilitator superfamily (MFS) profile domain-containing protein n=1 Tax=Amphimedon queenslandica TaxID=400682 RepID=A0A1X7T7I4_AMPQE
MATSFAKQLARKWQQFLHITPSAILVLLWNFLIYTHYLLFDSSFNSDFATEVATELAPANWHSYGFVIIVCFGYCSFPFLGLLADVWIGRYKAILIAWIILGIGFIVESYPISKVTLWTFYSVAYIIHICGYSSFYANIIPYNIDQLVGASSDELSSVIYYLNHLFYSSFTFFNAYFIVV